MTTTEQATPFTKAEFLNHIQDEISRHGFATLVCDTHIARSSLKHGGCIAPPHEETIFEWAYEAGYQISPDYNGNCVRILRIKP